MGSPIKPVQKGLPKRTQSLCPDCSELIDATILEDNGKVVMEKHCKNHGDFRDIVYSDAKLYLKMEEWTFGDNRGLENPIVTNATRCPSLRHWRTRFLADPEIPADTRLWAVLQQAGGGTWGGCVYDVDAITRALERGK
jgi:hypothetical protein